MKEKDVVRLIGLVDSAVEMNELLARIQGTYCTGDSLVGRFDDIYEILADNAHESFNMENDECFHTFVKTVANSQYSKEQRVKYVLEGSLG